MNCVAQIESDLVYLANKPLFQKYIELERFDLLTVAQGMLLVEFVDEHYLYQRAGKPIRLKQIGNVVTVDLQETIGATSEQQCPSGCNCHTSGCH